MRDLPVRARGYVVTVVALGVVLVIWSATQVDSWDVTLQLMAAYVVCDSLYTRSNATSRPVLLTMGAIVALASYPLVGAWGAALVSASAGLTFNQPSNVIKRLFNSAQCALAAGAGGVIYIILDGPTGNLEPADFPRVLLPFLVADIVDCAVNGLLVATVIALVERRRLRAVWYSGMSATAISYVGYGLFGVMLAVLWTGMGWIAVPLLVIPLFAARWAYAQYAEQQAAYDATIRTLVQAVETKDWYTRGHSERVAEAVVLIARELGMCDDRVASLRYAGILHDVGKLGVPTKLLRKAGALSDDEFEAIQHHPLRGREIVREIPFLAEAVDGILHHHERIDGRGYPMGLRGHDIPEFARIIAVADAFDSMTSTRSYRGARSVEEAIGELRRCAGSQFDPVLVEALAKAVARHGWTVQVAPPAPAGALAAAFDHDDPTVFPRSPRPPEPVEASSSGTPDPPGEADT
jgi:HD domain